MSGDNYHYLCVTRGDVELGDMHLSEVLCVISGRAKTGTGLGETLSRARNQRLDLRPGLSGSGTMNSRMTNP